MFNQLLLLFLNYARYKRRDAYQEWHIDDDMEPDKAFEKQKSKFNYVTSIIGEEYLQKELREMYEELVDFYENEE